MTKFRPALGRLAAALCRPRRQYVFRRKQSGFVRLAAFMPRWGSNRRMMPWDGFRAGEQGFHFEAYDPTLLVQRRNLFTYSEQVSNAAWSHNNSASLTLTPSAGIVGGISADQMDTTADFCGVYERISTGVSAGQKFSVQCLLKYVSGSTPSFRIRFESNAFPSFSGITINPQDGTYVTAGVAPSGISVTPVTGGGWAIKFSGVAQATSDMVVSFYSGTANAQSVLLTAAQVEKGDPSAYQRVTDWNTEYIAAALESIGMWQDSAGTTPVTGIEQPVGLWLDGKYGKTWKWTTILSDTFDTDTGAWTFTNGGTITGGVLSLPTASSSTAERLVATTAGVTYRVTFTAGGSGTFCGAWDRPNAAGVLSDPYGVSSASNRNGASSFTFVAKDTTSYIHFAANSAGPGTVDNVVVQVVPAGNHATQSGSTKRPILSARYNQLTYTGQGSNAAWQTSTCVAADNATAADGVTTATTLTYSGSFGYWRQGIGSVAANAPYTASLEVKAGTITSATLWLGDVTSTNGVTFVVNLNSGSVTATPKGTGTVQSAVVLPLANGSYRLVATATMGTANSLWFQVQNVVATGTFIVAKPDLRTADDAAKNIPAYQAVRTATDYDYAGFPFYLKFDGFDDFLQTASMDLTAYDKIGVWAAHTKLSDSAVAILAELSASTSTNNGTFYITSPNSTASTFAFLPKGTASTAAVSPANYSAPATALLTGIGDLSANPSGYLRINGTVVANNGAAAGGGTFGNFPGFFGGRGGTTLFFNGRLYGITGRASTTPSSERFIADMNRYAANLMAITI